MPTPGPHTIETPTYLTGARALVLSALFVLSLCTTTARAQYRFDHWTADNGLPQNSVRDIVQTRDGYLWLATLDGLVRFDGVRFTVFNKSNSPGIISNRFLQLYEDGQGDLWAITENSGLTRLQHGRFTTYTTAHGLPDNTITSIGGDGHGNLLMFFGWRLIRRFEDRFQPADDLRLTGAASLPSDRAQHLPAATTQFKVVCFAGGQLRGWTGADLQLRPRVPAQDHTGLPWFESKAGLLRLENGRIVRLNQQPDGLPDAQAQLVYGQSQSLQAFSRKKDGSLWLTDLDSGQSQLVAQKPPEGLDPFLSYADREGNYWLGTLLNGLFRARRQAVTAYTRAQGLMAGEVYPILEDRAGTIWMGSDGLFRFQNGVFGQLPDSVSRGPYTSLFEDRAARLWANGWQRLVDGRLERGLPEEVLPLETGTCWTMYEDHEGTFWFGMMGGVVRYKDGVRTHFTTKDGLAGDDTKVIVGDDAGGIWLGSYGGLTHFGDGLQALTLADEQARTQFTEFSDAVSQTLEEVRTISYDLRPPHLDQLGLRTALVAMIEKVSASSTIQFTHAIDDLDGLFRPGDEINIYRIAQECLNNILKHSGATTVALSIAADAGELALKIRDNGRGFTLDEDAQRRAGLGLQGIAERVRILGGTLAIESAPGQGTSVTVRIALKDKQR